MLLSERKSPLYSDTYIWNVSTHRIASGPFRVIWAMTFRSQFAQSLVDLHTQSELDPLKQVEAFYGGGAAVLEEGTCGRLRHRRISEARVLKSRCYLFRDLMMQNAPLLLETLTLIVVNYLQSWSRDILFSCRCDQILTIGMCSASQIGRCILHRGRFQQT